MGTDPLPGRDDIPNEFSRPSAPRNTSPSRPTSHNAAALSRSGTLSWQQRPSSRDSNSSRSRPFPGLSTELAPPRTAGQSTPERAEELSRTEIAESLGLKDPTWFRQTADRGTGSAALRRNQEDSMRETPSMGDRMRLPGMSRESTAEPDKSILVASVKQRAASPSQDSSNQGASTSDDLLLPLYPVSDAKQSHLPLSSSQRLRLSEADAQDGISARPAEILPPQSKTLSDRPPSPTKGLGGFVQSAMMKRSDSVNKRWSNQAAPGLKRGDSVASHRGPLGSLAAVPLTRSGSPPREIKPSLGPSSSPTTHSRPNSSHSTSTASQKHFAAPQHDTSELFDSSASLKLDLDAEKPKGKIEPPLDGLRSKNSPEELPSSPTKTMDPKRWSPTKASWLESALSKPESSKITSPKLEQPSWKTDIPKTKQPKSDYSEGRGPKPSFEVVTPPGLMRSPPLGGHSQPPSVGGLPAGFSSGLVKKSPVVQQKPSSIQEDSFKNPASNEDKSAIETSGATLTAASGNEAISLSKQVATPDPGTANSETIANLEQTPDSTSKQKPPALKPKPQTPPKVDFRGNLKPRQKDAQESASAEPEFKNVFGKLRRTETKNYVAPDVLKTNILTGKAALNLTGGPQKTKRIDEFKESLLSQKEAMKAGGGSINKRTESSDDSSLASQKPVATIPEALARRNQLSKAPGVIASIKPSAQTSIASKPVVKLPSDQSKKAPTSTGSMIVESSEEKLGSLELNKTATTASAPSSLDREQAAASTPLADAEPADQVGSGKLAKRMNPALASILMRGPPSRTSTRNNSTEDLSASISNSTRPTTSGSQDPGEGQLTHMTKGRAKGPKRRLPKTEVESKAADTVRPIVASKPPEVRKVSSAGAQLGGLDGAASTNSASIDSTSNPLPNRPLATLVNQNEKIRTPISQPLPKTDVKLVDDSGAPNRPKPVIAAKSPDLQRVSSLKPQPAGVEDTAPVATSDARRPTSPLATRTSSPDKSATKQETVQNPARIPKETKDEHIRDETRQNFVSKPQRPQKQSVGAVSRLNGLGLDVPDSNSIPANISKPEPTPPEDKALGNRIAITESPRRQAVASSKAAERASTTAAERASTTVAERASTTATGPAASQVLEAFFDSHPRASDKADIDAQAVVASNACAAEKTKTLRMQIWEVNGDGKRQDMPPQQEHILFEESMYLCVHSFENAKGSKSTEAFLWYGDNVGEAAVEDAQLFCRKIARENSAKLELLKQGKETASFIQALGGIIITRRSKSTALYMLCGRRHLGHVCFDEVDTDANNLCSGFPYLISARFGKLYLWKGKGSGADEVGCARLIGMDLDLTGEMEEVGEGEEPPSFWEAALGTNPHTVRSKWSDYWSLRGTLDQYRCRLFRIELDNPKSLASFWSRSSSPGKTTKSGLAHEIISFCQKDLETSHIFVLDAYFEIYVFVSDHASSKSAEFVTALFFAQEYSILAASIQDRPLVPPCHVVFSETSPNFRTVFRKWTPIGRTSPGSRPSTIPVNAAIEALVS